MKPSVTAWVLLLLALAPVSAHAEEAPFIQYLQVRGTRRPVELETHAGQALDRARLERDVRRLWSSGWFEDIRVESIRTPEGVRLIFTLTDKPRLYLRRIEFEPERERRRVNLPRGSPLDTVLAHRVAAAVRRELVNQGHPHARVAAELVPAGFQQADLRLLVVPGPRYRVKDVRFAGHPGLATDELEDELEATHITRLLPGLPGLWSGWRLHPPFSQRALQADLERLRAFYVARGFFDARVRLADVKFADDDATVTLRVDSGPRYRVRRVDTTGFEPDDAPEPQLAGELPHRALCRCLLEAKRRAEAEGALDFSARLQIEPADTPPWAVLASRGGPPNDRGRKESWINLTAAVEAGPAYRVGRIELRGHHEIGELTVRRAWALQEGDRFDQHELRRSLARTNRLGLFEPLAGEEVLLRRDADRQRVDLTVWLKEARRGRWAVSGPLTGLGAFNPFQFAVGSRLPDWGPPALALSTYYATLSVLAVSQPVLEALSVVPRTRLLPLVSVHRPYLPGQPWRSGFLLAPQLGLQATAKSYALTHARQPVLDWLAGDPAGPGLSVPVSWSTLEDARSSGQQAIGYLNCRAPQPRLRWLRAAGAIAVNVLLAGFPL